MHIDYEYFEDYILHSGMPGRSGRYKHGEGKNPHQHCGEDWMRDTLEFYEHYQTYRNQGMSDHDICEMLGIKTTELRARVSAGKEEELYQRYHQICKLKEHGYSNTEIANKMGINESVVRHTLKAEEEGRIGRCHETAEMLKRQIDEKGVIDIGAGVEHELGITRTKLDTSLQLLENEGYAIHNIKVEQATNKGKFTTVMVAAKPGTEWKDIYYNLDSIQSIEEYTPDGGSNYIPIRKPVGLDENRVFIRYAEDGGTLKDGTIELREGVDDLNMSGASYAQVRIATTEGNYLKGMAYFDKENDIPEGYDVVFNTNKHKGTPADQVFKAMKDDPENPFGAVIKRQNYYIDENGVEKQGVVNLIKEEDEWAEYAKSLPTQFLSKQPLKLAQQQLDITYKQRESEFEDIMSIENEAIRTKLLESFAQDCDSAAIDMKAAALPRQATKVIMPSLTLKDNEIYCPSMKEGEEVILVRYPHGGTFEIPRLRVNNHNKECEKMIGADSPDACCIGHKAAEQLSGADFDGDTAVVIPVGNHNLISREPLEGLKDFDPKELYHERPGMHVMTEREKHMEMGKTTNLIMDMTLAKANDEEMVRAVKHSMVVIDAYKHKLDFKQSEIDNNIKELKDKYQAGGGAGTLITRAKSPLLVPERKYAKINKETGELEWQETGRTFQKMVKKTKMQQVYETNEDGELVPKRDASGKLVKEKVFVKDENDNYIWENKGTKQNMSKVHKLELYSDANDPALSSGTKIETAYANYSNKCRALANKARKEMISTKPVPVDPKAKAEYANEIISLGNKLKTALMNSPRERKAQLAAAANVQAKKKQLKAEGKEWSKDQITKEATRSLTKARGEFGAQMSGERGRSIKPTEREWEAINNHALSNATVKKLMNYIPSDQVRDYAMPKQETKISPTKKAMIKQFLANDYTMAEIADCLNISVSTVEKYRR